MKKYLWIILIVGILAVGGFAFFYFSKDRFNSTSPYTAEKSIYNTTSDNINTNNAINDDTYNNTNVSEPSEKAVTTVEKEISTFSTKIQNKKDSNRQGNIAITCSALTNTIVEPGKTFSFCDVVGESTEEKGYKEANVIVQGVETKGLGGGNCQVSSTLYNAVLAAPELTVVERHAHSAPVPYIEEGKDAAISYGSHDFKFKNNSDSQIKIIAENTPDNITIKLIKLIKE